jgi:hypothetical protein
MGKADEYRRFAQECLQIAETVNDPGARAVVVQMAAVWLRWAEQQGEDTASQRRLEQGRSAGDEHELGQHLTPR